MKKIVSILVAAAIALAFVGCDTVTPTGGSLDLVATWTNVAKTYNDLGTTPAANGAEGTWTSNSIVYPTVPSVSVAGGVTTTSYGINDTQTTTTTTSVVIQASGSYVKTTTTAVVWTARAAAPANSATAISTGAGAVQLYAGSQTTTNTETVTVSIEGTAYKEVVVTASSTVYTGATKTGNVAYVAADNSSSSSTTTNYKTSSGALAYNSAAVGTQTVVGHTVAAPANIVSTTTTTTTWAFAKDGTFTETIVQLMDRPAVAAVAATATSAAVVATAAGTQTKTTTNTGTYSSEAYVTVNQGIISASQNQYTAKGYKLYMYQQAKTVSAIGTGDSINDSYPATAKTSFNGSLSTATYDIVINKNVLLVNGATVYTKPAAAQ